MFFCYAVAGAPACAFFKLAFVETSDFFWDFFETCLAARAAQRGDRARRSAATFCPPWSGAPRHRMQGPPCSCFSTCSPKTPREFLRSIPASVTSRSSPWYQYLRAAYGSDVPLPYRLTDLRYVYHHDDTWRGKYPDVEWPMPPCARLPVPLGGAPDGQWWAPMNWQVRKRIVPVRWRRCESAKCARWLSGSGEVNQSTHEAARERELKLCATLTCAGRLPDD